MFLANRRLVRRIVGIVLGFAGLLLALWVGRTFPLLGGLPIIGRLFSFTSDTENRRDLIILVTPRITDDGASDQ